jgi:iron complex outermembrane receptor protein
MKFKQLTIIILCILGFSVARSQNAQTDTTTNKLIILDEVQITAPASSNVSVLKQPVSIVKLDQKELKRSVGIYLDDAINTNIPGVFMQRRTISAGQQFNIRGYGNGSRGTSGVNSNFDGQGSKVYLNGIPVTDAEGITLMDDIDFGSVSNVDVTKGPSGTLYGLAIAGVVNMKTQKAEKNKTSIGQDFMLGNYGLMRATTHLSIGGENSSFLINYGHQESDGFIVHTASHKDFVNVIGDFHPDAKHIVSTYFGYSNSYDERQGELTIGQYDTLNYSGNPAYINNNAHSNIISFRAGIGYTYKINDIVSNSTSVFGSGISNNSSSAAGWTDKNPINYGARSTFDLNFHLNEKLKLKGVAGFELQQQYAQVIGYGMIANPDTTIQNAYHIIGPMKSNQSYRTGTSSVFTEWNLEMPSDFTLTAGIGISTMNINLNDRFYVANSTKPTNYQQDYKGMVSPHVALNKIFNQHLSVYVSYSKGYKAPVSSYFFIPATGQVNTGLKPEIGNQYEIGTKGELLNQKLHYEIALFDAIFSDKMTTVAVPLDPPAVGTAYSYVVNRGSQNDKGIEVLLKYRALEATDGFISSITPFANFTYSNFKYENYTYQSLSADKKTVIEVDYSGNAVAGVPPVTANVGFDIASNSGLYANLNYSYRDAMTFTSDGLNKTKAYSLLNSKIGFQRSIRHFNLDAYFGAINMTGTQYPMMVFLNQLPDAYLPAPYEINYFGGINLKYTF